MDDFEDLRQLESELGEWADENFPGQPAEWCLMGATEELGELNHSELKQLQGIRLDEDDVGEEATKDAVGDVVIYLIDFCNRKGIDFTDSLKMASEEVLDRDWDSDLQS